MNEVSRLSGYRQDLGKLKLKLTERQEEQAVMQEFLLSEMESCITQVGEQTKTQLEDLKAHITAQGDNNDSINQMLGTIIELFQSIESKLDINIPETDLSPLLAAIQGIQLSPQDLTPILEAIGTQPESAPKKWNFDVMRNAHGEIETVEASCE